MIKPEITDRSKELVIQLAKSLGIDFPKDRTCKDCFYYKCKEYSVCHTTINGIDEESVKEHQCWNENKTIIVPCDADDMSRSDDIKPYIIGNIEEAITCQHYMSGFEAYKRLYEKTKNELDKLKSDIKSLCK